MKMLSSLFLLLIVFTFLNCEENTIYEQDPKQLEESLYGNVVGTVLQKESSAKIIINQEKKIDSTYIDPLDGTFVIEKVKKGNYDMRIVADNYGTYKHANILVDGGSNTYVGEIDLTTIPDLVSEHYPEDFGEVVYNNRYYSLTISITFTQPMDRESVEKAFRTEPHTEGTFDWGVYFRNPYYMYYSDPDLGASFMSPTTSTITTYSKINSFSYRIAQKDSYVDTTYNVFLTTEAKDTAGNPLRFPLEFTFNTIQSSSTTNAIQTIPFHGDIDVNLISRNGIEITFPRNMEPTTTENAISISPTTNPIFLWTKKNELKIYTGGAFFADTTYNIIINSSAEDLDGNSLGNAFSFSFDTAPIKVESTNPRSGELFVRTDSEITMWFNTYMIKSEVENAFSISPDISGVFEWKNYNSNAITFDPHGNFAENTKYTITISEDAVDLFGHKMNEEFSFSFVTRPQ